MDNDAAAPSFLTRGIGRLGLYSKADPLEWCHEVAE